MRLILFSAALVILLFGSIFSLSVPPNLIELILLAKSGLALRAKLAVSYETTQHKYKQICRNLELDETIKLVKYSHS